MANFIPYFHFTHQGNKLTPEFCNDTINYYWFNTRLTSLLENKNIEEIDGYSDGNFSLAPFKRMYRSLRKQQTAEGNPNIPKEFYDNLDTTGIQWKAIPLIPPKLNAAIATLQKVYFEVTATCLDPLAQKKKEEDLDYIKNKPKMEAFLKPMYDSMNLGNVDLGPTKHSSIPFTGMPIDLDIEDEQEFRIFAQIIYNLAPETAFETILQQFYEFKKISNIRLLEIRDQYKYGVSVHSTMVDKNTDLPNAEYIHPGMVKTNYSVLPDFSDNIIRTINLRVTPLELFKYFPDEICDEDFLEKIVNFGGTRGDWGTGYCGCNGFTKQDRKNFDTFKMNLIKVEVKSVDGIGIVQKPKSKFKYFTVDTKDESKCVGKLWAQNTYQFYWLQNTKWFFGIDRLGFAYRSKGNETYTSFSSSIYKSQEKSAVELCIGENVKAQMADIKLQHSIIMSSPNGKVIDMKYIRNVIDGLTEEMDKYSEKDLLNMAMEQNIHLIDTEGFENKQMGGQYLPVRDLPGGLKDDIVGYYRVIAEAKQNISQFTGINDQLTGASANPEGLVGLQKLLISQSLNGLYYINEAIVSQYQNLFNVWAYYVQQIIKNGGAGKQAIINLIGHRKVDIIKGLNEIPIHQVGIKITLGMREEERAVFKTEVARMRQTGILNAADEYFILNTTNPKDALWLIAVKEAKWQKKQDQKQQDQLAAMQQMKQQEGQNMLQNTQAQTQGKLQQIGAETEGEAKLMQLGNQLGLSSKQIDNLYKRQLQQERISQQTDKAVKTIYANQNAKQQEQLAGT